MTASHLVIHQIRNMIETGKDAQHVAEVLSLPLAQVKRIMRAYDIKPRRPVSVPLPPRHKLMGGR
jgi:NADH:ubiquinone oxidoreductase subunit E